MQTTKTAPSTLSREKFTAFVSGLLGQNPNPEDDPQPGPWDPVIRLAFEKVFGPQPEPWREVFGPIPVPWRTRFESVNERLRLLAQTMPEIRDVIGGRINLVALNPQPLPPVSAFAIEFVRQAVDRLVLIQETADIINGGNERGIIVVGGKISELVDFVCGNNFPRPIPRSRPGDPEPSLTGHELILMGSELVRHSKTIGNETLGREFTAAGEKLIDVGLERI